MAKKRAKKKAARKRPSRVAEVLPVVDLTPPPKPVSQFSVVTETRELRLGWQVVYHIYRHNQHPMNHVATFYHEPLARSYLLAMNALSS